MNVVSFARINTVDGRIILETDDGAQLHLPLGLFVTLSIQARRLLPAIAPGTTAAVPPIPIRTAAIAVDTDAVGAPEAVLLRLDPGSQIEMPVVVPDNVAAHLAHDLLDALREKADQQRATDQPRHHS